MKPGNSVSRKQKASLLLGLLLLQDSVQCLGLNRTFIQREPPAPEPRLSTCSKSRVVSTRGGYAIIFPLGFRLVI